MQTTAFPIGPQAAPNSAGLERAQTGREEDESGGFPEVLEAEQLNSDSPVQSDERSTQGPDAAPRRDADKNSSSEEKKAEAVPISSIQPDDSTPRTVAILSVAQGKESGLGDELAKIAGQVSPEPPSAPRASASAAKTASPNAPSPASEAPPKNASRGGTVPGKEAPQATPAPGTAAADSEAASPSAATPDAVQDKAPTFPSGTTGAGSGQQSPETKDGTPKAAVAKTAATPANAAPRPARAEGGESNSKTRAESPMATGKTQPSPSPATTAAPAVESTAAQTPSLTETPSVLPLPGSAAAATPSAPLPNAAGIQVPTAAAASTGTSGVLDQIRIQLLPNRPTVIVRLDPPELGQLDIRLSLRGSGLRAEIRVERPEVLRLLDADLSQLVRTLDEAGLKVSSIDLRAALSPDGDGGSDLAAQDREAGSERDHSWHRRARNETNANLTAPSGQGKTLHRDRLIDLTV